TPLAPVKMRRNGTMSRVSNTSAQAYPPNHDTNAALISSRMRLIIIAINSHSQYNMPACLVLLDQATT
ncbi:MAG: hypothetical protein VCB14_04510, partial [Alphaproteobacteria bacterium]